MSDEAIAFFDQAAPDYRARSRGPSERLDELLSRLAPESRVLDVGCGPGVEAGAVAARGHRVLGIDAAPGMLAIARREHPGVEFRQADVRTVELREASFDAAMALFSLIFLPKPEIAAALRRLRGWLKPDGLLLVAAQGGDAPREPGEAALFRVLTRRELEELLRGAGFDVVGSWAREPREDEMPFRKLHALGRARGA
jgi:SAM-dependent methyltransferase